MQDFTQQVLDFHSPLEILCLHRNYEFCSKSLVPSVQCRCLKVPPAWVTSMTKSMEATRGMFSELRHTIVKHFTAARISPCFFV
jgi:hypothetical protein